MQMKKRMLAGLLFAVLAWGQDAKQEKAFTAEEKARFEALIKEYLMKHPEVIVDAVQGMRAKQEAEAAANQLKAIESAKAELFGDPKAQYLGSANADVTIVEFFDYRCGYCKQLVATLQKLVEADPKVRVILKELPILGPESLYASKAALAARSTGKYPAFHQALMQSKVLTEADVKALAGKVGVDASIFNNLDSKEVNDTIAQTAALAEKLGINGTPALIIGTRLIPGAVPLDGLKELVQQERAKLKPAGR